jgi:acyl carrier protein
MTLNDEPDRVAASMSTATERTLAEVWRDVLHVPYVQPGDNFFALGGNSMQAMQVIVRARRAFGRKLRLADMFATDDLRALAVLVDGAVHTETA